jgi:hypothetical protein
MNGVGVKVAVGYTPTVASGAASLDPPTGVSGVVLILDGDTEITTVDDPVSAWGDQLGANLLEQASAAAQPVQSDGNGGEGRVTFDDADDAMTLDAGVVQTDLSYVYIALRPNGAFGAGEYRCVLASDLSGGSPFPPILYLFEGKPAIFWASGAPKAVSSHVLSLVTPSVVRYRCLSGSAVGVRVNDNAEENAAHVRTELSSWLTLGDATGEPLDADVYAIVIVQRAAGSPISAEDDATIMAWLYQECGE